MTINPKFEARNSKQFSNVQNSNDQKRKSFEHSDIRIPACRQAGVSNFGFRASDLGFTLIEVMIVVAIFGIVLYGLFSLLSAGRTSWSSADTQIALQEELRKAMRQISADLAQSGAGQINISGDGVFYSAVSFNISQGANGTGAIIWNESAINYTLSGNQILRAQGSDSRVVANNITNMTFQRQAGSSDVVRIGLAVQKETQFSRLLNASLDSAVYLRN